jgi:hypothetical protein
MISFQAQYGHCDYDEPKILVSPVRKTGVPYQVVRMCPGPREVDYETDWYHLPATPSFLICPWCFETYIGATQLASCFQRTIKSQGRCRFFVPRLTTTLWPTAQRTGDLRSVQYYMSRRSLVPDCKGTDGARFADQVKWFSLTGLEIEGFVACEACYEDHILDSPFANFFGPCTTIQGQNDTWACDLHHEYIKRSFRKLSRMGNVHTGWASFVSGASKRFALPACEGKAVLARSLNWYRLRQAIGNLDFCEACYMDQMVMTPFENEAGPVIETSKTMRQKRMCDFNLVSTKEALFVCYSKQLSFDTFIDAAKVIAVSPRCCTAQGIVDGKWHDLQWPVSGFRVCEGCYAGILVPHGVSQFWNPNPIPSVSGSEELCAFNPRVPRFNAFINRWSESIETGVWAAYENYVRKWAPVPTCDRYKQTTGRSWYGWPECTICEDCYLSFADGTALAGYMPLQKTPLGDNNMCCMYSPRMRNKYTAACASGNVDALLSSSQERLVVYHNTVPTMLRLRQQLQMEQKAAKSKIALSFHYTGMNNASDLISSSGVEYGNSDIGYYSTMDGVEGARMYREGMEGLSRAQNPAVSAEIRRLEMMWKAAE